MSLVLRRAGSQDLDQLLSIEHSWSTTPQWTRKQFEEELSAQRSCLFVADIDGKVAGFAVFWKVSSEAHIMNLAVHPQRVKRGLGRMLVEEILKEARSAGCVRALLEVSANNVPAVRLYESTGFHVVGRRPKYYNDGSDAIFMDKNL